MTRTSSSIAVTKIALLDRLFMTRLDLLHYFLEIEISWSTFGINMGQSKYSLDFLLWYQMADYKPTLTSFSKSNMKLNSLQLYLIVPSIDNLLATSFIWLIQGLIFYLLWAWSLGLCKNPKGCIERQPSTFSVTFKVLTILRFTILQALALTWWAYKFKLSKQFSRSSIQFKLQLLSCFKSYLLIKQEAIYYCFVFHWGKVLRVINAPLRSFGYSMFSLKFGIHFKQPSIIFCHN